MRPFYLVLRVYTMKLEFCTLLMGQFVFKFSSVSLVASWAGASDIAIFTTMRSLRGLRPLRALSRFQGMKVSRPKLTLRGGSNHSTCHLLSWKSFSNQLHLKSIDNIVTATAMVSRFSQEALKELYFRIKWHAYTANLYIYRIGWRKFKKKWSWNALTTKLGCFP